MPKKYMIYGIIVVAAAILIVGFVFWQQKQGQTQAQIVETRDFSCPGMSGFTFKYPVFKNFDLVGITDDNDYCALRYHRSIDKEKRIAPATITVKVLPGFINPDPRDHFPDAYRSDDRSPQGVIYGMIVESRTWDDTPGGHPKAVRYDNGVWFALDNSTVVRIEIAINRDEFPRQEFLQIVIESFRLTDSLALRVGESGKIDNLEIKLVEVIEDSRCPKGVDCAWIGQVISQVELQENKEKRTIYLSTLGWPANTPEMMDKKDYSGFSYIFGPHLISISDVQPEKIYNIHNKDIKQSEYKITFKKSN